MIFNQTQILAERVALKARTMMIEMLNVTGIAVNWDENIENKERTWLRGIQPQGCQGLSLYKPLTDTSWILGTNKEEMEIHKLFFNGASKGNPGRSGTGGIILDPHGQKVMSFSWGLGTCSNNYAEILLFGRAYKL